MWKVIQQYPNYMINECGEVFSLMSNKQLVPSNTNGYSHVVLMKNGTRHYLSVHRLVAKAFVENPNGLPCVNHKDENKTNNHASNLEWCSYQYNNTYRQRHLKAGEKLRKAVSQFDANGNLVGTYESTRAASKATGIREQWIARTARGERKTCKGFSWKWAKQDEKKGEVICVRKSSA